MLSGGEAQRIKLATHLQKKPTGKTIYFLDEPTTGLHVHDVRELIKVLNRIVDEGDTLIIIEHNFLQMSFEEKGKRHEKTFLNSSSPGNSIT